MDLHVLIGQRDRPLRHRGIRGLPGRLDALFQYRKLLRRADLLYLGPLDGQVPRHVAMESYAGTRAREAAAQGYLNATEVADYLVRKGLAFRIAHELVGRVVNHAMAKGIALEEVALEDYRQFSPLFSDDVYEALKLETSLANKPAQGGTSPDRVKEALQKAKNLLKQP